MSILSLPNELILLIAAAIDSEGQISKLLRTNQRLKKLLLPHVYRRNVECSHSSALLHCCLHGNQQGLEYLLRWKEEMKISDCYGHSPVHLVARDALESTVKQLLKIGTEAHDRDTQVSIRIRKHDRVKWLRKNSTKLGDLLHTAVTEGYANVVETLLAHGVPAGYYCAWTGLSTIHLAALSAPPKQFHTHISPTIALLPSSPYLSEICLLPVFYTRVWCMSTGGRHAWL